MKLKVIYGLIIILAFFSIVSSLSIISLFRAADSKNSAVAFGKALIKPVSAEEIYPLFICPCCGKTIDADCCGMAKERKSFVDTLSQEQLSKEEIILAYIKKYGLDSFKDNDKKEEFRTSLVQTAPSDRPIISLTPDSYDFGVVSQQGGVAVTIFELENKGLSDLIINKIETSCGCTSASIIYKGNEGPRFAMPGHGINENIKDWQVAIPAGEKAELKVYYDPNVHQDFLGAAIREIYVFSNDPIDFDKKVKIELNQVK